MDRCYCCKSNNSKYYKKYNRYLCIDCFKNVLSLQEDWRVSLSSADCIHTGTVKKTEDLFFSCSHINNSNRQCSKKFCPISIKEGGE